MYDARNRDDSNRARSTVKQPGSTSTPILRYDVQAHSWMDEDARARRQPHTGWCQNSHSNDHQILPGKPRWIQWLATILLALTMCGLLPMAAAEGLIWFTDTYNCYWLVLVLAAGVVWFIHRLIERDL